MATYPFHGIFYFLLGYVRGYMESDVLIAKWYFNFYGKCFSILYIHHNSKIKKILTNLFKGNNNNNNLSNWYKQIYVYILKNLTYQKIY